MESIDALAALVVGDRGCIGQHASVGLHATVVDVDVRLVDAGRCSGRYAGVAMTFTRITVRAEQMGGLPCIRGLRIPVATVVGMVADGLSTEEIVADYPDLEPEDVSEALRYAAEAVRERELPLVASG
jgi:uncharacterized protein (DUF433 family)